jgi:Ion channel
MPRRVTIGRQATDYEGTVQASTKSGGVLSAILMFRRFERALRYAMREQNFAAILGAALTLVVVGTLAYTLGEGWNVVDGFYFAVATLTTSSIADPELVITNSWMKVFTAFYVLVGIGILVEVARQLGFAMIEVRSKITQRTLPRRQRGTRTKAAERRVGQNQSRLRHASSAATRSAANSSDVGNRSAYTSSRVVGLSPRRAATM